MRKVGRYEILEEIGQGGQSVAYKARDPKIDRILVIKQIRSAAGMSEKIRAEFFARFMREAQAAGRLSHGNIATIFDVGGDEEGDPFIAMEYVDGCTLDDLISRRHPLPDEEVLKIFIQLCSALNYAHNAGIVHRDIKPGNIMLTQDMQVKVVDFGIARLSASNLTQAGAIMGTPSYMSPEQIMGKTVDHRSDIFSLGVVLYETLTGERPFTGDNATTIIFKIVNDRHPRVFERSAGRVPAFDSILDNALAKSPEQRYATCAEMATDLEGLLVGRPPTGSGRLATGVLRSAIPSPGQSEEQDGTPTQVGVPPMDPSTMVKRTVTAAASAPSVIPASERALTTVTEAGTVEGPSKAILAGITVVAAIAIGVGAWFFFGDRGTPPVTEPVAESPRVEPTTPVQPQPATPPPVPAGNPPSAGVETKESAAVAVPKTAERQPVVDPSAAAPPTLMTPSKALPNAAASYQQARADEVQRNLVRAEAGYRRAVQLEPDNPEYVVRLGLFLESNRKPKEALENIEKAIELGGTPEFKVSALRARAAHLKKAVEIVPYLPYTAQAKHDHLRGGCDGKLTITENQFFFAPVKQDEHAVGVGLESIRNMTLKKNRLDVFLTGGKKYSFDITELGKLPELVKAFNP